jgi:hypothetical protein
MVIIRRFLLLLPVVLLAGSCSAADTLATVNGSEITKGDLTVLRPSYAEPTSVPAERMREDLTRLIIVEAVGEAAGVQFGYEVTEADITGRLADPPERYASILVSADQFPDLTDEAMRVSAIQSLLRDSIVPYLVEEDAGSFEALLAERPEEVTRACVRHINTATSEEATAVLERLDAGEDFVDLAAELSLDQTSREGLIASAEGECLNWYGAAGVEFARLVATAPLNEAAGPVALNNTWSVVRVEQRVAPSSAAELAADPMEYLDPTYTSALYTPWVNDAIREAAIDVASSVGRWSGAGVGIAPPGG